MEKRGAGTACTWYHYCFPEVQGLSLLSVCVAVSASDGTGKWKASEVEVAREYTSDRKPFPNTHTHVTLSTTLHPLQPQLSKQHTHTHTHTHTHHISHYTPYTSYTSQNNTHVHNIHVYTCTCTCTTILPGWN